MIEYSEQQNGADGLSQEKVQDFQKQIYSYYRTHGRTFPWRQTRDPYRILLSEIMLQQTQTGRVLEKYQEFLSVFPDFPALARASTEQLIRCWKGLGYNRRALGLREAARCVCRDYNGHLPQTEQDLRRLPMVGPATAGAVAAFAFSRPTVFIETNIRRVFIHMFFPEERDVHDRRIFPLIENTLDKNDPRSWYYALMDYGVMLKRTVANPNRRSTHYTRQSPFSGSDRQIRGAILSMLSECGDMERNNMVKSLQFPEDRIDSCLTKLSEEGFIVLGSRIKFPD